MALFEVKVPQLSESVAEATLLQWKKKPGEAVAQDEILIEIETDKVVLEVPAPAAGVLSEILVADGGTVIAEQLIARIDTDGKMSAHFIEFIKRKIGRYKICVDQGFPRQGEAYGILVGPISRKTARGLHRHVHD